MKTATTKETPRQIVTRYAKLIREAEKAWDTEEATRLLVERNKLIWG